MDTLEMATGRILAVEYVATIPEPPRAYVLLSDSTLVEAAQIFGDSAETELMIYADHRLEGYTRLIALSPQNEGIRVSLARG